MAGMDKLVALVNSFASAVLSVGREVGLNITLNKSKVSPGIKVENICTAALIGVVGVGSRGTVNIMLNKDGFDNIITAMSGGMIKPVIGDDVSMSVIGELSNMIMEAVRGMLPKNNIARKMMTRLKVFPGAGHTHAAQKPVEISL